MVRIAGLLHASMTERPTDSLISRENMESAVKIAEALSAHAEAAYQLMGADTGHENAKYLWKKLHGMEQIKKRDLFTKCQSKFKRVENMDSALSELEERGYIRIGRIETGKRPSEVIFVNPKAGGANG